MPKRATSPRRDDGFPCRGVIVLSGSQSESSYRHERSYFCQDVPYDSNRAPKSFVNVQFAYQAVMLLSLYPSDFQGLLLPQAQNFLSNPSHNP
ncbi:unnamed protein product [Prunus armeniaca]|uniref:Uncharacterized protein n=1 Tax=Prunus armeniaca TaxID=36596 RepID=A0A6J5W470_PRUAR|nr:unnamed protein product [Prunus armeniaca]